MHHSKGHLQFKSIKQANWRLVISVTVSFTNKESGATLLQANIGIGILHCDYLGLVLSAKFDLKNWTI